jgi:hypothetical protein
MPFDIVAAAYVGFLCLAAATRRVRPAIPLSRAVTARALRIAAGLLLALALLLGTARLGVAIGIVAWIAALAIAAVALVLLLSRSPNLAFLAAAPIALTGLVASLI